MKLRTSALYNPDKNSRFRQAQIKLAGCQWKRQRRTYTASSRVGPYPSPHLFPDYFMHIFSFPLETSMYPSELKKSRQVRGKDIIRYTINRLTLWQAVPCQKIFKSK